jgi:CRP-like cAMP-binding protein
LAPIDDDAATALSALCEPRSFAAGDFLLRAGERATWCFFLAHGLVRELYLDDDGREHTRTLMAEGETTGSLLDLLSSGDAVTTIQALEDTRAIAFRFREIDTLAARFPALHIVMRRSAEALYVKKTRREHEMLALTAAQRYARFADEHQDLDARVSRRVLASFLGITPEHLSRLRRRGRT